LARLPRPSNPRTTLSVGRIGGGIAVNAIPEEGWLEVDLRSTSVAVLDRYEREIHAAARAAADEENGRRARGTAPLVESIARIGNRPGGETDIADPLVGLVVETTPVIGREAAVGSASTYANIPMRSGTRARAIG